MGRTRSLRYALRPGGKKYEVDPDTGEKTAMERTGKVYDQGKLDGAGVFEKVLKRCWEDEWYQDKFRRWKAGERDQGQGEEDDEKKGSSGSKKRKFRKERKEGDGESESGSVKIEEPGEELVKVEEEQT
jgi:hypothetical protein